MSESNNKNRTTIANWIAFIGIVGLTAAMFFGLLLDKNDTPMAALYALLFGGGLLFLQNFAIRAKTAIADLPNWHIREVVCIVAYIAVAIFFAKDCLRSLYVVTNQKGFQEQANKDSASVKQFYDAYDSWRKSNLNNAANSLTQFKNNTSDDDKSKYEALLTYFNDTVKTGDIDDWKQIGSTETKYDHASTIRIKQNPDLSQFPDVANKLREESEYMSTNLHIHIADYGKKGYIPVIGGNFEYDGKHAQFEEKVPSLGFPQMLKSGFSIPSVILYVLLHVCVFFDYYKRQRNVDISGDTTDLGENASDQATN